MKNKNGAKPRKIDEAIAKTTQTLGFRFALISKMEIRAWKAYLAIFFVAGMVAAIIFSVQANIQTKSSAKGDPDLAEFQASPPKDPDGKEQRFEKYITNGDIVFFSQRMIGNAVVEKDQSVYVFDKSNRKLKEKKISHRSGLPKQLPANLITKEQVEAEVDGSSKFSTLYYASPDSDIFNISFDRSKPIWAVTSFDPKDFASLTIIDAVTGNKLGNGIPPPASAYSLTGPIYYGSSCSSS